ncbi:DUF6438 domain-containing protein [Mucilaginibacter flavus]|uniref:DUF6438 domain-containing protein n=1 Tax=Mucilaginibacter flavus TaxID=931504 RepID=UPI0025B3BEFF|nr:DUF6438 domain-containing protein [Mucilaginibacter flavus]MDN3580256.1 DUF6438 domain-containing protein [Mucilaginibacter flavus]
MNRISIGVLSITLFFYSCKQGKLQSANEKNILGDWVKVRNPELKNKNSIVSEFPDFERAGFSFFTNGTCNNKTGYLKRTDSTTIYLGNHSKYRISADSLYILNPDNSKWESYKLLKLTPDTLQFYLRDRLATFKHYKLNTYKSINFDKIILSTSGCYGSCPIMSIILNNDGTVLFRGLGHTGKKGDYVGKITKEEFQQLQNNFFKTNIDSLKNFYRAGWTDDETISTTFVKNGKIYKTVDDYGRQAPYQFTWAYIPLRYLYQHIKLKPNPTPVFFARFNEVRGSSFRKDGSMAPHTESETFLLFDYLRNGKQVNCQFNNRFKLHIELSSFPYYDIDTDGRYYTFIQNGKPVTIDIGFNFYDINAKNREWRKITEYD